MRRHRENVLVRRQVEVELIPDGTRFELPAGTMAEITQALGSSFTLYVEGRLVRLQGEDADAIGKTPPAAPTLAENASDEEVRALVWETLKTCYDPEIPVDIVELGLVYVCDVLPVDDGGDDGGLRVSIKMTLTAPGCGMGESIAQEVRQKLSRLPRIEQVDVEIVFDPPWSREMMSEAAELSLGL
ncbi:MAG: putative Fe-S cluster assembly protein SufT [Proteobacteria bacterium]|nr:putative Fe-S cluster assembly protein SufT [Pseudomonadota bacterium]